MQGRLSHYLAGAGLGRPSALRAKLGTFAPVSTDPLGLIAPKLFVIAWGIRNAGRDVCPRVLMPAEGIHIFGCHNKR